MGSSSDGLHTLPEYPQNSLSSAGDMRFYLQNLLDSKEKQLQQAGTLGQRVLAQQMELEERIRQLQELEADKSDDDELEPDVSDRYRELADSIMAWDAENAQLSSAFGASLKRSAAAKSSPPFNFTDLPHENLTASAEPDRSTKASSATSTSAAAQSRRAKNAAHRADDVEFAFEIGSGLLTEVRRLQSLLGERDKAIQDIKEEKDDLEKTVDNLKTALRQQEQSADKFKEENWNLEVTIQELRTQFADSVTTNARLESDHKRINKLLAASRDAADTHQNESERVGKLYEELKLKHENDMAIARKNTAAHAREKNELSQTIDSLKADLTRATRRFGGRSPLTPGGPEQGDGFLTPAHDMDHSDIFTGGSTRRRNKLDITGVFAVDDFGELLDRDDSPEPSPIKGTFPASNHPSSEIEALQKRLAHAQRQINTLKGTLTKEKQMRLELHNKLNAPVVRSDSEEDANEQDARGNRRLTPFRVGGRGRGFSSGNRGMTLMQRLGMATSSPVASYADYGDEDINGEEIPQASHVPSIVHRHDDDDEVAEFFGSKQSKVQQPSEEAPEQPQSNRTSVASVTSVEGMDPQFANVLKRVPSNGSSYGSPLRQSVLNRSARGRGAMNLRRSRGGVPFKDGARPPSLVDPPDILAAELSGLMGAESTPLKVLDIPEEDEFREFRKELVEFGCQTEDMEDQTPEPKSIAAELGIQVDLEPVPEQPKVELVEMSTQTEPEPTPFVIEHSEFGVQCSFVEPLPVKPVLLDVAIETETPAQAETQTLELTYADSKRTTITSPDLYSRSANTSSSSSDATVIRQFLAIPDVEDDLDEGEETETGADTENEGETDADNYFDARSISMLTPASESRDDFHSVMTVTDNGYSDGSDSDGDDDDSDESIKASRLNSTISLLDSVSSSVLERSFSDAVIMAEETPKSYSTVCVSADLYVEKEPEKVYIVPPKPESKEMSIQTDEWLPPLPILSTTPISPSPTSFRTQHQFQFIPPPPPSAAPSSGSISNGTSQVPANVSLSRTRSSASDRRQSIESAISSINAVVNALNNDETRTRPATALGVVDRSKPPTMILPPPPRAPPPPNTMLPPSFIPERKSREVPPPRPSSPPPPELVRAATPVGGMYGPKSNLALRSHGSSVPPSQTGLKQPPSTSSFRSTGNAQIHYANGLSAHSIRERSNPSSAASPRSSVSSERDLAIFEQSRSPRSEPPTTPNKSADITPRAHHVPNGDSRQTTDPVVIHAITQTMIGEFLYKYTRRTIGKGHGERRHLRFFWVHPYTKTLYWSSADPGSSNVTESMAKSAYIEGVRSVLDPNPMPPGLYQYSVIVSTPQREMKITCPTKERHDIWFNALKYLLARPTPPTATSGVQESPAPLSDYVTDDERQGLHTSPQSQRSVRSVQKSEQWTSTPRGQRSRSQLSAGGSIGKRSGTPALEYLRWNGLESPYSPTKSFVSVPGRDDDEVLDFELHGDSLSDDGFEGLENVRACCDGRHTVGHSNKHHHHHHHHHAQNQQPPTMVDRRKSKDHQLLDPRHEIARPASPSTWSFRSRAGSTHSNEGGSGLFSLRFGSRRSAKNSVTTHD